MCRSMCEFLVQPPAPESSVPKRSGLSAMRPLPPGFECAPAEATLYQGWHSPRVGQVRPAHGRRPGCRWQRVPPGRERWWWKRRSPPESGSPCRRPRPNSSYGCAGPRTESSLCHPAAGVCSRGASHAGRWSQKRRTMRGGSYPGWHDPGQQAADRESLCPVESHPSARPAGCDWNPARTGASQRTKRRAGPGRCCRC